MLRSFSLHLPHAPTFPLLSPPAGGCCRGIPRRPPVVPLPAHCRPSPVGSTGVGPGAAATTATVAAAFATPLVSADGSVILPWSCAGRGAGGVLTGPAVARIGRFQKRNKSTRYKFILLSQRHCFLFLPFFGSRRGGSNVVSGGLEFLLVSICGSAPAGVPGWTRMALIQGFGPGPAVPGTCWTPRPRSCGFKTLRVEQTAVAVTLLSSTTMSRRY